MVGADGGPDLPRTPFRISTFDENAIEAALQIAAQHKGRVFAVSVVSGATPPRDVLLRCLAMGVEVLYLVKDDKAVITDPYRVAVALAAAATAIRDAEKIPSWNLILAGEASADQYNAQVGPRLAVALGLAAITYATKLDVRGDVLIADRSVEEWSEQLEVNLPVLVTVGTEINQARMPTVLQIMGAGRKPIHEIPLDKLAGFDGEALARRPSLRTISILAPVNSRKRIAIEGKTAAEMAAQLLARLGSDGELES
jgi:electron transfer flavoprotein beta subunit